MLYVKDLSIYYSTKNKQPIFILNDVQLEINAPCIYGILGPNGAGKTTFIKTLLDLHKNYSGTIKLFGKRLTDTNKNIFSRIGYASEDFLFYKDVTSEEYLKRFNSIYQNEIKSQESIDFWLEELNLSSIKNSLISTLSKGMKKRLLITLSMLNDPDILFLDEPFEGLDPLQKKNLRHIIKKRLERGKTSIISSHEIDSIEKCCTQIGITSKSDIRNFAFEKDKMDLESIYENIIEQEN